MQGDQHRLRGHTLIELIVVLTLVGSLVMVTVPAFLRATRADVRSAAGNLVVSEINYNPSPPTPDELDLLAALGSDGLVQNDDFEFIELQNVGSTEIFTIQYLLNMNI